MNQQLKTELISMHKEDQRILHELIDSGELGEVEYHPRMKALHEQNTIRVKEIIADFGWPSISLVGKDGSKATWLIVQHAVLDLEFMGHCLSLLKNAVSLNEADGWCFAYLQDRILTMSGKLQIYGTQHDIDSNDIAFPMPIEEPNRVEELRKKIGLEPLNDATKRIQEQHDLTIINQSKNS